MLGAVAGLACTDGVEVGGMEAVGVSYPGFEQDLAALLSWARARTEVASRRWSWRSTGPREPARAPWRARWRGALGFTYLDSGAMYRAVGAADARATAAPAAERAEQLEHRARRPGARRRRGRDRGDPHARGDRGGVAGGHRPERCARRSSRKQRELLAGGDWVAEGRDIGTVVAPGRRGEGLPDRRAAEERARRRADELGVDVDDRAAGPGAARRSRTRTREHSPLRAAPARSSSTPPA